MKKIVLSKKSLSKNERVINDFLSKKGLSVLKGGTSEWGNSNYAESTYVRRTTPVY